MKQISIILTLSLLVSSCSIFRPFEEPVEYNSDIIGDVTITENDIVLPSWQEIFTDPLLQDLIKEALANNTDLRSSELRINSAKAALTSAKLSFLPNISLSLRGISADLDFDFFGKILNNEKGAEQAWYSSQAYSQIVRSNLVSSVAATYYTLQMLDRQLEIGKQSLKNWEETERALEAMKLRDPSVNEASVLQAKAQRLSLESSVLSIEKSITETENEMCSLIAKSPMHILRSDIDGISLPESLCDSIPLKLVAGRSDVNYALHNYAKAYYMTNVAKSSFFPNVSFSGVLDWQKNVNITNNSSMSIFNNGYTMSALKAAKAEQEIAKLEYEQALLNAGKDVNNALVAIHTADQKSQKDGMQVKLLEEALRKTELLMKHSTVNYLEVLTSEQALLNAKESYAEDMFSKTYGLILLYQALGGSAE